MPSPDSHDLLALACMPALCIRRQHNPRQLKCTHGCRKWFKTTGGRTRHIRSFHNAKAAMHPSRVHHNLNPDEAIDVPHSEQFIHLTHTRFLTFSIQMKRFKVVPHQMTRLTYRCLTIHFLTTIHPSMSLLKMYHLHDHQHATSLLCRMKQAFIIH